MMLCLDAGNSRLKWGVADASGWRAQGDLEWARLAGLRETLARWRIYDAYLASVVGATREAALMSVISKISVTRFTSASSFSDVKNGYTQPETLGVDRWCALIGARQREKRACLVVMLGTATTVDALDSNGKFLGGMVLPGLTMMQEALAKGTARLPKTGLREDSAIDQPLFPVDTESAIVSGCLEAQAGAIERAFMRLPGAATCFISGGASQFLTSRLSRLPVEVVSQLALEGVRVLACATRESTQELTQILTQPLPQALTQPPTQNSAQES